MSGKYSDNTFFFANYGCCIPTESYAWILVALFVTAVLVLLFCMVATATIRWMYKRRMRKRLHDLKRKFLHDQMKAQEFEAKLNYMANKNRGSKNEDGSREAGKSEKFTIYVDPAQNYAQKQLSDKNKKNEANQAQKSATPGPIYDRDETPIAQSTLPTEQNVKRTKDNRWFYLPQDQRPPPQDESTPIASPSPIPQAVMEPAPQPVLVPAPPPVQKTSPPKNSPPKKSPPHKYQNTDLGNAPIINEYPKSISPEGSKKNVRKNLAPPTATTTDAASTTVSSSGPATEEVTTPLVTSTDTTSATPTLSTGSTTASATSEPNGTTGTSSSDGDPNVLPPPPAVPAQNPSPPKKSPPKDSTSPGDDVKHNVHYGSDDIVSPVAPPEKTSEKSEDRKEGKGGRSEWKYYYADGRGGHSIVSSTTKSSGSNGRSTSSWLFDSTGSNRLGSSSGKNSSVTSSSILKTDSSHYKTASIEQFPHGAFDFQ